jgi:hypothetical protein
VLGVLLADAPTGRIAKPSMPTTSAAKMRFMAELPFFSSY